MSQAMSKKTVFLLGATGYIGSRVLDELISARPDLEIVALTRRAETAEKLKARGVVPVLGDLAERGDWEKAARAADYVVDVAQPAAFNERGTHKFGLKYERERLRQDKALFGALDPSREQRIIYVSGHSYFGDTGGEVLGDEMMAPKPIGFGPYIVEAVKNVRNEVKRGLDIVSVYPGAVYAYGSWTKQFVIDRLRDGKKLMALPGKSPLTSPIHVQDVARAIVHMLDVPAEQIERLGRDFLLVDNKPVTFEYMNGEFAQALGKTASYMKVPGFMASLMMGKINYEYQTTNCAYDNSRLRATGFQLKYPSIESGAPEIVAEARQQWQADAR